MSRVAEAIAHYDELLLGAHRQSTIDSVQHYDERWPSLFPASEIRLRPFMLEAAEYRAVQGAAEAFVRSLLAVVERLLGSPELRARVGVPPQAEPILDMDRDHGGATMLARLDGHLGEDGVVRFLEYNSAAAGVSEMHAMNEMLASTPIARDFGRRCRFVAQDLLDEGVVALERHQQRRGARGFATVAVLRAGPDVTHGAWGSGAWLCHAASRGARVLIASADEFTYADGSLTVAGCPVDVVALMTEHLMRAGPKAAPILAAIRDGAAAVMHGLSRSLLARAKSMLAVLSDPSYADAFGDCISDQARKHVPWTRVVGDAKTTFHGKSVDLLPFVEQHRDQLVLKPNHGRLGEGVVLGWEVDGTAWTKALERANAEPSSFVVQERVEPKWGSYPVLRDGQIHLERRATDVNPFVWNGDVPGGAVIRFNLGPSLELSGPGALGAFWLLED
jgi:hypothetical protein